MYVQFSAHDAPQEQPTSGTLKIERLKNEIIYNYRHGQYNSMHSTIDMNSTIT
jgi:hypothetical protein